MHAARLRRTHRCPHDPMPILSCLIALHRTPAHHRRPSEDEGQDLGYGHADDYSEFELVRYDVALQWHVTGSSSLPGTLRRPACTPRRSPLGERYSAWVAASTGLRVSGRTGQGVPYGSSRTTGSMREPSHQRMHASLQLPLDVGKCLVVSATGRFTFVVDSVRRLVSLRRLLWTVCWSQCPCCNDFRQAALRAAWRRRRAASCRAKYTTQLQQRVQRGWLAST